ncbi:ATP-grasp domain-containing protein [Flexivirga meconopsidis]|uniref:ATP-grasp domain-containing protein n=1 Tax=Flexivirga meconopsidis TaxID=2977121 RepID=UPI00223FEEA8|nr:hypothetical protein [Flexivirga meconopsidis]
MSRHVLILNRWTNRFAEYHRHLDHERTAVSYLTTQAGAHRLSDRAEEIRVVDDIDDIDELTRHATELATLHGGFTHIVALSEFDLIHAGILRDRLGVPGRGERDVALVRDKVAMKHAVAAAGLRVPWHRPVDGRDHFAAMADELDYPVVVKPRLGADSQEVHVLTDAAAAHGLLESDSPLDGFECEEFIQGEFYQVDGVVADGELRLSRSWHCLASCLDFAGGLPFASVANDDADLERRITDFTVRVTQALRLVDDVFHLELFVEHGTGDLVFLEVGARAGGGQVRFVWDEVYGVDLVRASLLCAVGDRAALPAPPTSNQVAGYLMMPQPPMRPCTVHSVSSLRGTIDGLYAEELPTPGTVLAGNGGAIHTAGVYRFALPTAAEVEAAIARTREDYRIDWSSAGAA